MPHCFTEAPETIKGNGGRLETEGHEGGRIQAEEEGSKYSNEILHCCYCKSVICHALADNG